MDAVTLLINLNDQLPDFCRRALLGRLGNDAWDALSTELVTAARACREQIVIDIDTTDT